jgi:hypothetical protein
MSGKLSSMISDESGKKIEEWFQCSIKDKCTSQPIKELNQLLKPNVNSSRILEISGIKLSRFS